MATKQTKHSNAAPEARIDYGRLPANLYEIAGDFGGVAWVTEKQLPRPEPSGFFSDIYPRGVNSYAE